MNKNPNDNASAAWSELSRAERQKLIRRAAPTQTRAQLRAAGRYQEDPEDQPFGPETHKIRGITAKVNAGISLLKRESHLPPPPEAPESQKVSAEVVTLAKGLCKVDLDGRLLACRLAPQIAATQQTSLAVGDRVLLGGDDQNPVVQSVLARKTFLSRPDPGIQARERVIVANVDVIVVVVSVVAPPLHPRLVDRYLVAIQRGGARPLVCVNKIDLLQDRAELQALDPYLRMGIAVLECSAQSGHGVEDLRSALLGRTSAFVGHSGVGKSALLNSLRPDLNLKVGSVSEGYGRGTHTTTAGTMHAIAPETRVIDTPGIRSFGLFKLETDGIALYFQDVQALAAACRYRDCSHTHEPDCAVKQAVQEGNIDRDRYETYVRIMSHASSR